MSSWGMPMKSPEKVSGRRHKQSAYFASFSIPKMIGRRNRYTKNLLAGCMARRFLYGYSYFTSSQNTAEYIPTSYNIK